MAPPKQASPSEPNSLEVELVEIDSLVPDDRNARKGAVSPIVESLREFGQHRPIVAKRQSRKVLIGNHMLKAAQILGWTKINVYWVDDDDKAAIRRALADNATGDLARWDQEMLRELVTEVGSEPLPGIDDKMVEKLFAEVRADVSTEEQPIYPIVAEVGEQYSYVIVLARSMVDDAWLRERFGLRMERSYKSSSVGTSRVVTVERLREEWGELTS